MWRYYADFVLFPCAVAAVVIADCRSPTWVGVAALGFALWTFAEYWVHRTALHGFFWHGRHERHHDHPAEYVIFPVWQIPAGFAVLYLAMPHALFAGFAAGYVWFLTMHHWLHHIDLAPHPWLYRYSIWHNRHHKLTDCNYGITAPVWDWAFGTSR